MVVSVGLRQRVCGVCGVCGVLCVCGDGDAFGGLCGEVGIGWVGFVGWSEVGGFGGEVAVDGTSRVEVLRVWFGRGRLWVWV